MSGAGAPTLDTLDGHGVKIVVVAAQWHTQIMDGLLGGARRAVARLGAESTEIRVPGTFELPVAALHAARSGADAVVALGVVVRGGTPHFEYVCEAATHGLTDVAVRTGVPVGFGVLTVDTVEQALDRAGLEGSGEDKGAEAVEAVVATVTALRELRTS